jgi:hypothetical protein
VLGQPGDSRFVRKEGKMERDEWGNRGRRLQRPFDLRKMRGSGDRGGFQCGRCGAVTGR